MPRPGASGSEVYVQATAPLAPDNGDFWYDTSTGNLNFRRSGGWLAVAVDATNFATLSNNVSVLSQAVSVLSQAQSVLSQAVSVLSDKVSVLSNAVSVVSQAQSVLSQAVSVLSQAVSVLSQAHSVLSNDHSVLSQVVSLISVRLDTVSQAHSALSNIVSVISAGLGGVQLRAVANSQIISGTTTTKVSGLSISCAAAATYQIEGQFLHNISAADAVIFNISGTTSALSTFAGDFDAGSNVSVRTRENFQNFPWTISIPAGGTSTYTTRVNAVVKTSAAFTIQVYALASVAGKDINIKPGSYLRAYKIG